MSDEPMRRLKTAGRILSGFILSLIVFVLNLVKVLWPGLSQDRSPSNRTFTECRTCWHCTAPVFGKGVGAGIFIAIILFLGMAGIHEFCRYAAVYYRSLNDKTVDTDIVLTVFMAAVAGGSFLFLSDWFICGCLKIVQGQMPEGCVSTCTDCQAPMFAVGAAVGWAVAVFLTGVVMWIRISRLLQGEQKDNSSAQPLLDKKEEEAHTQDNKKNDPMNDFQRIHQSEVFVTLDMDTINCYLIVSQEDRSVRWTEERQDLPDTPERFDEYPCVLGRIAVTRWRCYWEVEVGSKRFWELGVARETVDRKGQLIMSPETGFWVLSLWDGQRLKALTDPETPLDSTIPSRVGVYLDYEKMQVSFYNAKAGSLIHTFNEKIDRTVRPFFSPGNNDQDPLTILSMSPN